MLVICNCTSYVSLLLLSFTVCVQETEMTELSRSQSMPRLLSGTLQVWTDEMELETGQT